MTDDAERRLEDETGEHYVVVERRRRHQLLGFSTWQWAVIATFLVSVVIGTAVGRIALTAKHNTERLNESICAQVVYLDGIKTPGREQQRRIDKLVRDLRRLQDCPPAPPPIVSPGG